MDQHQARLLELKAFASAAAALLKNRALQQAEGPAADGGSAQLAAWSATRPPAQYVPPAILDDTTLQDLLDSQMSCVEEVEATVRALKGQVATAQKLWRTRKEVLRNQHNRWHNQQGTSALLALPSELLQKIAQFDAHREVDDEGASPTLLELWPMLSALATLPSISSLSLWVDLDLHSEVFPAAGASTALTALSALTHLQLCCCEHIMDGGSPPVVKLIGRMPALACLELQQAEQLLGLDILEDELLAVLQALLGCKRLQDLHLATESVDTLDLGIVAGLTLTLTSLRGTKAEVTADHVGRMLPAPTPIAAFTLEGLIDPASLHSMIELLAASAPRLRELSLKTAQEDEAAALEPSSRLELLTNLQTLSLSGGQLVRVVAASLPAMPALTRLQLPHSTLLMQASLLAALTQLTYLQLGARFCYVKAAGRAHYESYLPAIRQMRSLAELVLDIPKLLITEPELREMLPPPPSLHRLVVNWPTEESGRRIMRVVGPYVRDITLVDPIGRLE